MNKFTSDLQSVIIPFIAKQATGALASSIHLLKIADKAFRNSCPCFSGLHSKRK